MLDNQYWHTRMESIILQFDYVLVDIVNSKKIIIFYQCVSTNFNLPILPHSNWLKFFCHFDNTCFFYVKFYWVSPHRHFSSSSFRRWIKVFCVIDRIYFNSSQNRIFQSDWFESIKLNIWQLVSKSKKLSLCSSRLIFLVEYYVFHQSIFFSIDIVAFYISLLWFHKPLRFFFTNRNNIGYSDKDSELNIWANHQ